MSVGGKCHGLLERALLMFAEHPALLKSAWQYSLQLYAA